MSVETLKEVQLKYVTTEIEQMVKDVPLIACLYLQNGSVLEEMIHQTMLAYQSIQTDL